MQAPESPKALPDFPLPRRHPLQPPLGYEALRETAPVTRVRIWDGTEAWLITRYDDYRRILREEGVSADTTKPGFPFSSAAQAVARGSYPAFVSMDPPKHGEHRRMLTTEFMGSRMEALKPRIQNIVDDLVDGLLRTGAPLDLMQHFARPLPSRVICLMLGVPYEDHEFFETRADILVSGTAPREVALQAGRELIDEYLGRLIDRKADEPQDDILSRLVVNQLRTGQLTRDELLAMARLLLVAGHDTTSNMIVLSVVALLHHPDQLAALKADPALIPLAVEELLRFLDPTHGGRRRIATKDIEIGGQLIRAGEGIIALNVAADRDPEAFPDPNRFDIRRGARHHVAFGFGIHQCLGQLLARTELKIVIETLFRRVPGLHLATPFDQLQFQHARVVYGLKTLPVAW